MALYRYFKSADSLPKPLGTLSSSIPSSAVEAANTAVRCINQEATVKKRGPYLKMDEETKAKYASENGDAAVVKNFSEVLQEECQTKHCE